MMKNGYIRRAIRKTKFNLLILAAVMVIFTVLITNGLARNYYNALFGPFEITASDLQQDKNVYSSKNEGFKYFFKIKGEELKKIGQLSYAINPTLVHTANYYVLKEGPYLITVVTNTDLNTTELKGILVPTPEQIHKQIKWKLDTGDQEKLLPIEFDTTGGFWEEIRTQIILGLAFSLLTLAIVIITLLRLLSIKNNPLYKSLKSQGMPEAVAESFEDELENPDLVRENYRYIITPSWMIRKGPFTYKLSKNYFTLKK